MSNQVKISDLSLKQVAELQQSVEEEVKFVQAQLEALHVAKERFVSSRKTMQELHGSESDQPEMLVPMTESVYHPGRLLNKHRFIIDLGAGYYVERSYQANFDYLNKRINTIEKKSEDVLKNLIEKKKLAEILTFNIQSRIGAASNQQIPA
eukprot:Blabericola_migrator_1__13520@NODE_988_length_5794_cov_180_252314_g681_i0_p4_GENE_NODE_988_length_5794_cov_180_252314_g681_i0NODE_988_length_5794_cov_180_252314_g681_i0_p4_ORF_typecomplete_len151_score37_32Prefoldin/PF02996_17/1_2e21WEMBL/PF05701_11/15WEMBL/PF05701_11/0_099TLE_N/PF03920_15/0_027TLE_N/PF03920_15/5_6e02Mod_r/PF07200_13/0_78Prefoldin_2/PF01920_20/15Prefoldin_2/PF01920_20/1_1CLZ/PF16526_5/0_7CLZ/PF16526_5/5_1e02Sec34/PF04136_15/0_79Sec34/PF04136_15/1_3e02FlxA/PF14282_6/5_2FlxA/PF142